jgi:hypothetical protein
MVALVQEESARMFFTRHLSKMLLITGLATASVFIFAVAPQWAIVNVLGLPFSREFVTNYLVQGHQLIYQHWGVMVGFMGVVMVVAAFKPSWRHPAVFFAFSEKALMVLLFVAASGFSNPNMHGFFPVIIVDTIVSIWIIGYWIEQRSMFPDPEKEQRSLASQR